jgi:hypothetical protein
MYAGHVQYIWHTNLFQFAECGTFRRDLGCTKPDFWGAGAFEIIRCAPEVVKITPSATFLLPKCRINLLSLDILQCYKDEMWKHLLISVFLQLDLLHMSFFMSRYVQIKFLICLIQPIQAFRCTSYKVIGVHKFGIKTCIWNFFMFHVPESTSSVQKVNFPDWSTLVSLGVCHTYEYHFTCIKMVKYTLAVTYY